MPEDRAQGSPLPHNNRPLSSGPDRAKPWDFPPRTLVHLQGKLHPTRNIVGQTRVPEREKKEKAQRTMSRSSKAPSLRFLLLLPPVPALFRLSAPPDCCFYPFAYRIIEKSTRREGEWGESPFCSQRRGTKRSVAPLISTEGRKCHHPLLLNHLLPLSVRGGRKELPSSIHPSSLFFLTFLFFCDAKGRKEGRRERQVRSRER
jgi:hypothetical protein